MTLARDLKATAAALESGWPMTNLNRLRLRRPPTFAPSNQGATEGATNMSERDKSWAEMTDRNSEWFTWPDILEMTGGRTEVTLRVVKAEQGKIKQSDKRVVALTLDGAKRRLGLNATNAKMITSIYGTDKPSEWAASGILLTLYVGRARDPDGGGDCNCVRIRAKRPEAAQLHGAAYDHAAALALIASAKTGEALTEARVTIAAQRPPEAHHAELKSATAAAEERIKVSA